MRVLAAFAPAAALATIVEVLDELHHFEQEDSELEDEAEQDTPAIKPSVPTSRSSTSAGATAPVSSSAVAGAPSSSSAGAEAPGSSAVAGAPSSSSAAASEASEAGSEVSTLTEHTMFHRDVSYLTRNLPHRLGHCRTFETCLSMLVSHRVMTLSIPVYIPVQTDVLR